MGMGDSSDVPPQSLQELSFLHALLLINNHVSENGESPPVFVIRAGSWSLQLRLLSWFNEGALKLDTSAAAGIIHLFHKLEGRLQCPLIIKALPGDYL